MEIVMRKVSELTPYEKNAKKHDDKQIANVANSIRRFGWQQPIVIDENVPSSFGRNPDNVFSRVDLPTPLAPNKHVRLPSLSSPLSLEATILAFFDLASYPILRFLISMQFIGVE